MQFLVINPEVLIVGGAAIFSVLVVFIITFIILYQRRHFRFLREKQDLQNSFQREILKTQLETQENTFCQIGEEIHDNIGQLLSSVNMLLGTTERNLANVPESLKTAQDTLINAISELRALSKSLNKEWLHQFDIIENLETEVQRINTTGVQHVEFSTTTRVLPLVSDAQIMLFRIIQEALNNSVRHARARTIRISIDITTFIKITVADDGSGMENNAHRLQGVGLINMHNRTNLLGGSIAWKTPQDGGTEVVIQLPLQKAMLN